jgi:Glycosyl hydrolase family 9/Cellulase N-terminal ig-like domain
MDTIENQGRRELLQATAVCAAGAIFLPGATRAAAAPNAPAVTPVVLNDRGAGGRTLLVPDLAHSLDQRCRAKPVLASRLIDDMEQETGWKSSPAVTLGYTTDRARSGTRSLRFRTLLRNEEYIRASRAPNGSFTGAAVLFDGPPTSASARLRFASPQDWSGFNRLSLWCYLHPTVNTANSLSLQFLCQGASAGPADPVSVHYIGDLRPGEWNHLVWEISEYQRDAVVEFVLFQPLSGLPLATSDASLTYDFDQLQVESVEVETVSGWEVPAGKIAYSHIGYQPGAPKLAICADSGAEQFELLDAEDKRVIATLPAKKLENRRGHYRVLDFTGFNTSGRYQLRYGNASSDAFEIGSGVWGAALDATLNAIFGLRCGCAVPGVHDACHLDVFVEYKGERRVVGGGWHDAANLTQAPVRTHLTSYALLRLYERLAVLPEEVRRATLVLDEARWGLDWLLRMRFGPGVHCLYGNYSYWTDGKVGADDDVVQTNVGRDLFQNVAGILAAATAARVLRAVQPELAARLLGAAREDHAAIIGDFATPPAEAPALNINQPSWRDLVCYLTLATVELYRASGQETYRADAVRLGGHVLNLQERRFVEGSPITGYFYEDGARSRMVHEYHNSHEESGLLALQALCDTFPQDAAWIDWYAALLINSEYYCRLGSTASAPFDVLPAAVWRRNDLDAPLPEDRTGSMLASHASPLFPTPPSAQQTRAQMQVMFDAATPLTDNMRLRVFPLWHNHVQHGGSVVQLARNAGLTAAAQLRGRRDLIELGARQLQWLLGANPFSRSLLYGVGYDYWQNFTVAMPNLVGGLSLGFNSYRDDAPAWGNNAVFPYKEMWIFASSRAALNLASIGLPARIRGHAAVPVEMRERRTGARVTLRAGRFERRVPAGDYVATGGTVEWNLALMEGQLHELEFDPRSAIDMQLVSRLDHDTAALELKLRGNGRHVLELRLFNATSADTRRQVTLRHGIETKLVWSLRIKDAQAPWVGVVIADGRPAQRQECFGQAGTALYLI